ncbi:MAG TPA: sterol desaturase family protein [Verrucomicrobiae bacterium]|nr:sterol desaturase family protein [Verrucomicrobiae bacterium]
MSGPKCVQQNGNADMMLLTWFRHGSNAVLTVALVALAAAFALRGTGVVWWGVGIGALAFLVSEYTTHRFLFHAPPQGNAIVRGLQHRLHYDHHIDPPRLDLLFLPLWFVIPTVAAFFGVYWAVARDVALAMSLLCGSLLALTYYEWAHYVAHLAYIPPTPWGKWMKRYHLWHHYKNEKLWFGVTNPSMDFVGATFLRVADAERSDTTRELFG